MTSQDTIEDRKLVWSGRPSVSVYYSIYGAISVIAIAILVITETWLGNYTKIGRAIFPASIGNIPYPAELATAAIFSLAYLAEAARLALLRKRNKYELYADGLYIDKGIVNLENVYLSPMAFSDARLLRPLALRVAKRGNIIVDTNDQRHFRLQLIGNPAVVQDLIRKTLGHPTVRLDK
ncbi:MAG: hypothetical protein ACYCPP_06385 [Nitrososphaerales archaeon]